MHSFVLRIIHPISRILSSTINSSSFNESSTDPPSLFVSAAQLINRSIDDDNGVMGSSRESSSSVLLEKQRAKQWADHHGISSTSPLRLSKASVEVPSDNTSSNSSSVLLEKQRAKQWASDHLGGSSSTKAFKAAQPQDLFAMIGREPELDEIFKGSVKLRLLSHTQNNSLRIISYRNSVLSYITPAYRIISHHNYIRIDRSIDRSECC